MCRFKSGIILKNKNVIAQGENNSHSDLLEELKIEDTVENAMRVFVRAELIPTNNEWWTNVDIWEFNVDQDITPEWFELDKEKYEQSFREDVKAWCKEHVLVDKKIDELSNGYYMLKNCEVKRLCKEVSVICDNSTIGEMYDNSTVNEMWGNSTVNRMCNNSTVNRMYGNSTVNRICGNSTVTEMWENSTVTKMYGNSIVTEMWENSTVTKMFGNSTVTKMCGNSIVTEMWENSTVTKMYGNSIARDTENGKVYISKNCEYEIERK